MKYSARFISYLKRLMTLAAARVAAMLALSAGDGTGGLEYSGQRHRIQCLHKTE